MEEVARLECELVMVRRRDVIEEGIILMACSCGFASNGGATRHLVRDFGVGDYSCPCLERVLCV